MNPLEAQPDESLLRMIAGGDKAVAAMLFRRHAPVVRKIAQRILRDAAEADDLVQEIFIFLFHKAAFFKDCHGSARSRILQVAYCRAFHRRSCLATRNLIAHRDLNRQMLPELQNQPESSFIDGCVQLHGKESAARLWQWLSLSQMRTMDLHFFEGYTFEEIAHRLDQKLGNIRRHYYHGIEKMRRANLLSQIGIDGSGTIDWDFGHDTPSIVESQHADDYFVELCALWSTGTLSPAEWHQLEVHLSQCSDCQAIKTEYDRVLACLIPALAAWLSSVDAEEMLPNPDSVWLAKAVATLLRNIG